MGIFHEIKANPEGGTVGQDGRGTPDYGFFVGGHGEPAIFSAGADFTPDLERQISDWVNKSNAPYIGWWTDEETGKLYLDGSDWIESESTATQIGRLRKEIAVWDVGNERELRLVYVDGE